MQPDIVPTPKCAVNTRAVIAREFFWQIGGAIQLGRLPNTLNTEWLNKNVWRH